MSVFADAIFKILDDDVALTASVTEGIHLVKAPQGTGNPSIVIQIQSKDPTNTKGGIAAEVELVYVQIDVYTDTYRPGQVIAEEVKTALNRYTGTPAGTGIEIDTVLFENQSDFFDDLAKSFRVMQDYRVRQKI